MKVVFNETHYKILLNYNETENIKVIAPFLQKSFDKYTFRNNWLEPTLLYKLPLEMMEGEVILDTFIEVKKTSTYPFYLTNSDLYINWEGELAKITPKQYFVNPVLDYTKYIIQFDIGEDLPILAPYDKLVTQGNTDMFVLGNSFEFEHDFFSSVKTVTLYSFRRIRDDLF